MSTVQLSKIFLFQAIIQFSQTVLIQTIQFSISIVFVHTVKCQNSSIFQTIQFSISTQFSSIWSIDRTLSGATTLSQSEPGSDSNEGVLHIPQSSSITGTSPSDCLASHRGHSWRGVLLLYRGAVGVFYSASWLSKHKVGKPLLVVYYLIRIFKLLHNSVQCIYEEWDIRINVHRYGI